MNYSDTERIESYLDRLGFKKAAKEQDANLVIFNSCSIRKKAEDRVLGKMKNLTKNKRSHQDLLIALTGCMVRKSSTKNSMREIQDKYIKNNKLLDIAFRIEELPKLKTLIEEASSKKLKTIHDEQLEDYFHISPNYTSKTQAFIPISTGCDKFCTYCIVPYSRGRETSRNPDEILKEATELVQKGCLEITLLGQTVDSYGLSPIDRTRKLFDYNKIDADDQPPPFVQLLKRIDALKEKGLKRLRFSSPHPKDVSPYLIQAFAELKTLMPHIHLPIQSGDNSCLQRMNRPYTRERYLEIINALRKARPDITITTDFIVGFCGETEEEFQNTLDLYKEVEFDFCYISQYSNRKGTYADKNLDDDVPQATKAKRWHEFNDLMKEIAHKKLQEYVGQTVEVLVEEAAGPTAGLSTTIYRGKSEHFKTVQFQVANEAKMKPLKGTIQHIKITKAENWILFGDLV
jgi:tRNA-2-methylthio-N6-dimethylallyladenosine synthase